MLLFSILIFASLIFVNPIAYASETSGTIISGGNNGYAWSGEAGWMNFGATNGNIQITDSGITGYVWNDNYGWINMAPTNGGITIAANGALSGYAWGSGLGWINFSGVTINSSGRFVGTASGANVGTLTFDCTNCSVTTDYRPSSSRTVATTQQTVAASGAVVGGAGGIMVALPPAITAINVPLTISPTQSGTLSQNLSGERRVDLNIQRDSSPVTMTFTVSDQTVSTGDTSQAQIVDGAVFNIQAFNVESGERIRSFLLPIRITLTVSENMEGRDNLGVYFFDEGTSEWTIIPGATFVGNKVTFLVDHLTLFGIFSIPPSADGSTAELPQTIPSFFEVPSTGTPSPGGEGIVPTPSGTEVTVGEGDILPAQLFDINLEIESTKIADAKDLIARLLFTSFGRVPTPVDITFAVVNKEGETVYSKKDTITVQTQAVLTERFSDIDVLIPAGTYTLLVTTLYNTNVRDEFKQDFEVTGEAIVVPFWRSLWFWVVGGLLLIFMFILAIKKMGDDEESTSAEKFSALSSLLSVRRMKDIR